MGYALCFCREDSIAGKTNDLTDMIVCSTVVLMVCGLRMLPPRHAAGLKACHVIM